MDLVLPTAITTVVVVTVGCRVVAPTPWLWDPWDVRATGGRYGTQRDIYNVL